MTVLFGLFHLRCIIFSVYCIKENYTSIFTERRLSFLWKHLFFSVYLQPCRMKASWVPLTVLLVPHCMYYFRSTTGTCNVTKHYSLITLFHVNVHSGLSRKCLHLTQPGPPWAWYVLHPQVALNNLILIRMTIERVCRMYFIVIFYKTYVAGYHGQ